MKALRHALIIAVTLVTTLQAELKTEETKLHRFKNADETKTFEAELKAYSPKSKRVSVRLKNGRIQMFDLKILCQTDQAYVLGEAKRLAIVNYFKVSARKFSKSSEKSTKGSLEERSYPTGYEISIDNASEESYDELEVQYTIYYGVQGYEKSNRETKESLGSLTYKQLEARRKLMLRTNTVEIVSGKQVDKNKNNNRTISRTKRRKDVIYGCKIDIILDGKVVKSFSEGTLKVKSSQKSR